MIRDRGLEALGLQPLPREQPALVPVCTVTEHGHDRLSRAELLTHLRRGDDVERGGCTEVQTLGVEQLVDHPDALLVRDVQRPVDVLDEGPEVVRNAALADTCPRTSAPGRNPAANAPRRTLRDRAPATLG